MPRTSPQDVTALLLRWREGDDDAMNALVPVVHDDLRRLAGRQMAAERPDHLLQVTALVNEAYVRLVDARRVRWQDRAHFFAMAARLMRRVLIDIARARKSGKRDAGGPLVTFDEALPVAREPREDLIAIDDALAALAKVHPRQSQVVELRFFGGLGVDDTAEALSVSRMTVMRDWTFARSWLRRELSRSTSRKSPE